MRLIIKLVTALVLGIGATVAAADVTIVDDGYTHYAAGQLAAAETPAQMGAYVYCQLREATLYCGAYNGAGAWANCSTTDVSQKKMFPMMGKASTIQFFIDPSGTCSRILVYNHTVNLALVPAAGAMKFPVAPSIDTAGRSAQGTVSADPTAGNEGIHCEVQSFGQIFCSATNSANTGVACYGSGSATQSLADQILAISGIDEY